MRKSGPKFNWFLILGILLIMGGLLGMSSPESGYRLKLVITVDLNTGNVGYNVTQMDVSEPVLQSNRDRIDDYLYKLMADYPAIRAFFIGMDTFYRLISQPITYLTSYFLSLQSDLIQNLPSELIPISNQNPDASLLNNSVVNKKNELPLDSFQTFGVTENQDYRIPGRFSQPGSDTQTVETIYTPERIVIPIINLDAPVVDANRSEVLLFDQVFTQWLAPDGFAAGWHTESASLGVPGNTVINGHHNMYGRVFENLIYLSEGDIISVFSGDVQFDYVVVNKMILPDRDVTIQLKMENARWISRSDDERLTLITCWPWYSNTHRLIIVGSPIN
jgi:LPXTG-site transpeptidase (sortase) family protein